MHRFATCLALAVVTAAPAFAAEIRPSSEISSVTVYASGASVLRTVPVELPAGPSIVILDNLPLETETDSITVEGSAGAAVEIGSVATRIVPADKTKDPAREAILDAIRALEDKRADIGDRIGALDGRQRFVEKMLETMPGGFGRALGAGTGAIEQWSTASKALGDDLDAVASARRALEREDRALAEEIDEKNKALGELPPLSDRLELRIELASAAPASGELTVGYRAPSAWWVPTYHAQLATGEDGGDPSLSIIRRAEVTQQTGEDWSGVALTLSTARPAGGTAAPYLEATLASLGYVHSYAEGRSDAQAMDQMVAAPPPVPAARAVGGAEPEESLRKVDAVLVEAQADFGDFRAEYKVPGEVSLASGKGARAFRMATDVGKPELEVRAVPLLTSSAYLTARFTAPSAAPFLAGKVALFRDGAFVGQGEMPFVAGGAKVDLGFGVDDSVKVTRVELDRAVGENGIFSSRRSDTRRFRITVENLHKQPIRVTVLDRMPYSEDEKIEVVRLDDTTDPTVENIDDRRGVLSWSFLYEAGESREIQNAYRVSWPAGETVVLAD
jgi:uncharacterized protein (TIGR02231 family)